MTKVVAGEKYRAFNSKSGTSTRGAWEFVSVADEKGHFETTIYVQNVPSGVQKGGEFVVEKILSVKNGMKKSKNSDKWFPETSIEAIITPCAPTTSFGEAFEAGAFTEIPGTPAGDPWAGVDGSSQKTPWDDYGVDEGELPF